MKNESLVIPKCNNKVLEVLFVYLKNGYIKYFRLICQVGTQVLFVRMEISKG